MAILVVFLILLLTAVLLLQKYWFTYWYKKGVYTLRPALFFGNASSAVLQKESLGENIKYFYDHLKKREKRFGGYYLFCKRMFVPIDLKVLKKILITDFDYFTDHIAVVNEIDTLSTHIFNQKGHRWRLLRNKLSPSFTSGKMRMMFETLLVCVRNFEVLIEEMVDKNETILIKEVSDRYTIDAVVSCTFGIEGESIKNPNSDFQKYKNVHLGTSFVQNVYVLILLIIPEFYSIFKIRMFDKNMTDFFLNLVKETVKSREENSIIRKDFMHLLLQIRNNVEINDKELGSFKNERNDVKTISLKEMAAQCFVFFFAGIETTAVTLSFALLELALNSDIQDKLRDEINAKLAETNGEVTYDAVVKMEYLNKCVSETLRKFAPIQLNTRLCTKTYTIPGTDIVIDQGTPILIPIHAIHRDPEFYPDPEKFDPERFSEENMKNRDNFAYMPFGSGPRICIGYRFGLMIVKLALVVLLHRFKFCPHPDVKVPLKLNPSTFITNALIPIKLNVSKIE